MATWLRLLSRHIMSLTQVIQIVGSYPVSDSSSCFGLNYDMQAFTFPFEPMEPVPRLCESVLVHSGSPLSGLFTLSRSSTSHDTVPWQHRNVWFLCRTASREWRISQAVLFRFSYLRIRLRGEDMAPPNGNLALHSRWSTFQHDIIWGF